MENTNYINNGVVYNLNNIWDADDLKFDFWYRLQRHQQIFYEVMKLNNIKLGIDNEDKDCTKELLEKIKQKNKKYNVKILWNDE